MSAAPTPSPMFRQYRSLKNDHPDSILLFRMGDFYEMFDDDAREASRLLELTLTARGKGTANVVPMCGFPHHQLDAYAARLVRANRKVAICEQVEDARKAKGLVRREIVRIVTPGTFDDPARADATANVWIASVSSVAGRPGAAFLDASTGEFLAWEPDVDDLRPWEALADRLLAFAPREVVYPEGLDWKAALGKRGDTEAVLTEVEPYPFALETARRSLGQRLGVASLDGFGFRDRPAAVAAAGGLLQYVEDTQRSGLEHIDRLLFHEPARFLLLDPATRRNLELERSLRDGGKQGSLVGAVDATITPGGGRQLRRWLLAPLLDSARIAARLDATEGLVQRPDLRNELREQLRGVYDIERLLARTVGGTAGARDLLALRQSLERVPALLATLDGFQPALVRQALDGLDTCRDVSDRLARGLVDDPPATLREGGVIREGFNAELDELRSIRRDGRSFIASLEADERKQTGIGSLKVRFNKVFGYFIEVTKANLHSVPEHYVRKQTIANGERYITPQLKEHEAKVLQAQERIESLEQELFATLRQDVALEARRIKAVARTTALIDTLSGLAETAARHGYIRPVVDDGLLLRVRGGRHPVVAQLLVDEPFVPNDTTLEASATALAVLTGPNMGGKSTYLRQVALITLLAQAGSFVPADEAHVGIVDRIFCRVGASDSLAEGQSTFMVEMTETANILHHATARSLLLLDEIGRGTSTFDGLSIAWAVVEHLAALEGGAPRTLFATHYHELTELAAALGGVTNLRMAVRESGGSVAFLHRVEAGASDRSYGIHVAQLAGVPATVVDRAREILANIERDEYGRDGAPRRARRRGPDPRRQPALFAELTERRPPEPPRTPLSDIADELRAQDVDHLTPVEALNLLATWKRRLDGRDT